MSSAFNPEIIQNFCGTHAATQIIEQTPTADTRTLCRDSHANGGSIVMCLDIVSMFRGKTAP